MWSCVQNCLERAQHANFNNNLFSVLHILHQLHYYKLCKTALVNFCRAVVEHPPIFDLVDQTIECNKKTKWVWEICRQNRSTLKGSLSLSLSLYCHWGISTIFNGIELAAIYMMQHCKQVGKTSIESLSDCRTPLLVVLLDGTCSVDIHDGCLRY